jgi:hypothetical protein
MNWWEIKTYLLNDACKNEEFKTRVREEFVESIVTGYLRTVYDAEHGLSLVEVAKRIGLHRGQATRWSKKTGVQRPSLRNFCLRAASANASFPNGARIAFDAYAKVFKTVAKQMKVNAPPEMSGKIACCLYFMFHETKGHIGISGSEVASDMWPKVLNNIREYYPEDVTANALLVVENELDMKEWIAAMREYLIGRLEIWTNLVIILEHPNAWF